MATPGCVACITGRPLRGGRRQAPGKAKAVPPGGPASISASFSTLQSRAPRRACPRPLASCLDVPHFDGAPPTTPTRRGTVAHPRALERAKSFFFSHFERIFVVLLFASMLIIHYFVDEKLAFLSFYYLPIILAGFYGGRPFAGLSRGLLVAVVRFFPGGVGVERLPGLDLAALLMGAAWGGVL